jgi:hypothetical protein
MKYIAFLKQFIPKELPKPVGRWRLEQCSKQMKEKIDLANEDHCGTCGQYAKEKRVLNETKHVENKY